MDVSQQLLALMVQHIVERHTSRKCKREDKLPKYLGQKRNTTKTISWRSPKPYDPEKINGQSVFNFYNESIRKIWNFVMGT